jgi:hypothetical protein
MKTAFAALLITLSAFAADGTSTSEIKGILETWRQALLQGDAATLERLYSNDLTYTHSSGKTETKAESIRNATNPDTKSKGVEFHDPAIRIYGNAAVVKTRADFTTHTGDVHHLEMLVIWIKSGSGWQLVAGQTTTVH